MENIFKKDSWKIEEDLEAKMLNKDLNDLQQTNSFKNIKLRYLNPIFFDEDMLFDIEMKGEIVFDINNKKFNLKSNELNNSLIKIENTFFNCNNICDKINILQDQYLIIEIKPNSNVKKFNIIKNLEIESCNQNK